MAGRLTARRWSMRGRSGLCRDGQETAQGANAHQRPSHRARVLRWAWCEQWGPARSHIFRISGSAVFRVALRIGGKSEGPIDGLIRDQSRDQRGAQALRSVSRADNRDATMWLMGTPGELDLYWTGCRDGRGVADVRLREPDQKGRDHVFGSAFFTRNHHLNSSISAFQPSASFLISSKTPSAAKWCGNSQSGRAFILLTNEATAFLSSPRSR